MKFQLLLAFCLLSFITCITACDIDPTAPISDVSKTKNSEADQIGVTGQEWVTNRFGRSFPNDLNWSVDPEITKAFAASGVFDRVLRIGEYTIVSSYGLYWSNEDHRDDSKDMRASVIIFSNQNDGQKVFVARGYKFMDFRSDADRKVVEFEYWNGVNRGDKTLFIADCSSDRFSVATRVLRRDEPHNQCKDCAE
jgi:hypothetical protein